MLKPVLMLKVLEAKFPQIVDTYAAHRLNGIRGKIGGLVNPVGNGYRYWLQPLTSIHPTQPTSKTPSRLVAMAIMLKYLAMWQ